MAALHRVGRGLPYASVTMVIDLGLLSGYEQSLVNAGGRLSREGVGPIRKIKRSWRSNGFLFQWTEQPDIYFPKLRNKIDVGWSAQSMRDGVSSMVKWTSA